MIRNLYFAPVDYDWSKDPRSVELELLTKKNLHYHLNTKEKKDFYTSIEDLELRLEKMQELIDSVDAIHLVDITVEFLCQRDQFDAYNWWNFVGLLNRSRHVTKQYSIDKSIFSSSHPPRTDDKTLFVAGCSITAGSGVLDHQRYGDILAKKLNMPYVLLAKPGASIQWTADRILQSDLRCGDIVVWGLTTLARISISKKCYNDWDGYVPKNYLLMSDDFKYFSIDYLTSWTLNLSCIKQILQVENFCRKIGAKLYLANVLETTVVPFIFGQQENYINCIPPWNRHSDGKLAWVDLGSDNDHPGPLQHQLYVDQIYNHIISQLPAEVVSS